MRVGIMLECVLFRDFSGVGEVSATMVSRKWLLLHTCAAVAREAD